MNDRETKYTLDASNEKNRKLWMEHVQAVMDVPVSAQPNCSPRVQDPEPGHDDRDMFKKSNDAPRPVSKREMAMQEERVGWLGGLLFSQHTGSCSQARKGARVNPKGDSGRQVGRICRFYRSGRTGCSWRGYG